MKLFALGSLGIGLTAVALMACSGDDGAAGQAGKDGVPGKDGSGAGTAIVGLLAARARAQNLPNMTLVAVNNSVHFWQRQGFTVTDDPALSAKLTSYGGQARFMTKDLS
jgi:hypothetical protein